WIPWLAARSGADLYYSPYYLYPYAVPLPVIITIHDLIPLEFSGMIPARWGQRLYRPLHRLAARRANHIMTDSAGARDAILRHLRVPPDRITVVHAAPDPFFTAEPATPRESYLFSLISNKPHKNGRRLLGAFAAIQPQEHGIRLVIAGPYDPHWPSWEELAAEVGVADWVTALGRISEASLREHYRRCGAFVFPSFAEGFGLPVLEAMACGAPVVVADASPMRDLAAGAALRFAPFDEHALAGTLHRLLAEPALRSRLSQRAVQRAAEFSWQRSAREMLAVCESVLEREQLRKSRLF
ncbi:MAG: glycosyltransferase family 4 protein, partial [Ardenticatenaceae bacterium]